MQNLNQTQYVAYYSLFNPEQMFNAPSKLMTKSYVIRTSVSNFYKKLKEMDKDEKEEYLRERSEHIECRCHHYNGDGGICTFHTCRHSEKDHP